MLLDDLPVPEERLDYGLVEASARVGQKLPRGFQKVDDLSVS